MFARTLTAVFAGIALVFLYFTWEVDEKYATYMIPFILLATIVIVLSPQINWWWYSKNPPMLDRPLQELLMRHHAFFRALSNENKKRFCDRVVLFMMGNDYKSQSTDDDIPEDLKFVVAVNAVHVGFGQTEFLFPQFETIVLYPKAFPSPQFPRHFHASEIFEEDGVVLMSAQHLMPGFMDTTQYYNIGLHEYAKVFRLTYPAKPYPKLEESVWEKLEQVSGFSQEAVEKFINLPEVELDAVAAVHFLQYPVKFKEVLPEIYQIYMQVFNLDPVKGQLPIIEEAKIVS